MEDKIKLSLIESYDRMARERETDEVDQWKLDERENFYQLLVDDRKESLLDIGAGTGYDSKFFKDQGFKVVTTDLTPEMVRLCKEKGLRAYVMDFYNLEFPAESFDAVWALNCLLHVPKASLPKVLKGIKRVMKPGGLFYMGVYGGPEVNEVWEHDPYLPKRFFAFYPEDKMKEAVSQVFDLIYFKQIPHRGEIHFQSMILRK